MWIIFVIIFIIVTIILFLIKNKNKSKKTINNLELDNIARLIQVFEQKTVLSEESTYFEHVKLYGKLINEELVVTPFSKKEVVYYQASATVTFRKTETFKDTKGFDQTKITTIERTIFNDRQGNKLLLTDNSTSDYVIIESNSGGCQYRLPINLEKEVSKEEFEQFGLNITLPLDIANSEILNYKIQETYLEKDETVYVFGEARKSGGKLHICLSMDLKTPLIVSKEDIN